MAGSRGSRGARTTAAGSQTADAGSDAEPVSAPVTAVTTVLATLAGAGLLAVGTGALLGGILAAVTGGLLTGAVTATNRRTPGGRALGSVLAVLTAIGMTASMGLAASSGPIPAGLVPRVGVVVAIGLATFGATATTTGAVGHGAVRSALPVGVLTSLPITVVAALHLEPVRARTQDLVALGPGGSSGGWPGTEVLLAPESTVVAVASFVSLAAGLCWTIAVVVPRLPIPELAPRDRREEVRLRTEWATTRVSQIGLWLLPTSAALAGTATLSRRRPDVIPPEVASTLETWLLPVAMSTALRIGILAALCLLAALLALSLLPGLYRLRYNTVVGWLPVFTGGTVVALLLTRGYPWAFDQFRPALEATVGDGGSIAVPGFGAMSPPSEIVAALEPPTGIAIAGFATTATIGTITALLLTIWLLGAVGPLPDRGAPGSLAAAALVAGAILAGIGGAGPLVVSGAVACAIVAWDAAVYGVSVVDELGRDTAARRPALAHTTGAVVVGCVGVALALGVPALAERLTVQTGVTIALSLTVALLVSMMVLKRWATAAATPATPSSRQPNSSNSLMDSLENGRGRDTDTGRNETE